MSDEPKRTSKTPIIIEPAEGINVGGFADRIADVVIEAINAHRKSKGLAPLSTE